MPDGSQGEEKCPERRIIFALPIREIKAQLVKASLQVIPVWERAPTLSDI